MVSVQLTGIFLAAIVAVQAGSANRPGGSRPGSSLGSIVLPSLTAMGWGSGWIPTTAIPTTEAPTTAPPPGWGWSTTSPTTEPPPGWGWSTTSPTTQPPPGWGWTTASPTTQPPHGWGWNTTPPPTVGWQAPGWQAPGWQAPGWQAPGWQAPGWQAPVDISMEAESAVVAEGEAGSTHGSHTIVTGDSSNPAQLSLQTGSSVELSQGTGITQNSYIAPGSGWQQSESQTFQAVDAYNGGTAGDYYNVAALGNNIQSANGGASFVLGSGALGQNGITFNNNPNSPLGQQGWSASAKEPTV